MVQENEMMGLTEKLEDLEFVSLDSSAFDVEEVCNPLEYYVIMDNDGYLIHLTNSVNGVQVSRSEASIFHTLKEAKNALNTIPCSSSYIIRKCRTVIE